MQRVAPSSSSSVPSFQLTSAESNFLCHSASRGPSSRLSAQVGCVCLYYHLPLTSFHSGQVNFDSVSPRVPLLFSLMLALLSLTVAACFSSPQSQPELRRNALPPINLERWYQDIMAAGEPQSCPPPLPAKSFSSRKQVQVNSPLLFPTCTALCTQMYRTEMHFRFLGRKEGSGE